MTSPKRNQHVMFMQHLQIRQTSLVENVFAIKDGQDLDICVGLTRIWMVGQMLDCYVMKPPALQIIVLELAIQVNWTPMEIILEMLVNLVGSLLFMGVK